jgi:uncharacterized protein DUF6879
MRPPDWALAGSVRLNLDEFSAEFSKAWLRIESRFLKLECWQAYQEADTNQSQEAYRRGEMDTARQLLAQEAEADRALYDDIKLRSLEFARVRLVTEPLSSYLEYELMSYNIRAGLGERIEVVVLDKDTQLPSTDYFDFLLFDRHTALVHDYGAEGVGKQIGGWVTYRGDVIERLERTVAVLRRESVPLSRYLAARGPS